MSIHPAQEASQSQATVVYEIVASEQLPCFDPTIFVNQKLAVFGLRVKSVMVPIYFVGLALRFVDLFVGRRVGEVLAVVSVVFQSPMNLLGVVSFRYEYVKVLAATFEFYFLAATATVWIACALTYVQDLRAVLLSIIWVDFVGLLLIEAYFGESKNVFFIAVTSGIYLVLFTGQASLRAAEPASSYSREVAAFNAFQSSETIHPLTIKDALVNTMGTMVMLMMHLAYRKYNIMKQEQRHESAWMQSIGYRCRIALRSVENVSHAAERTPAPRKRSLVDDRCIPMRFIKIPTRFHSDNTVLPFVNPIRDLERYQLVALYACGAMGYVLSTFVMAAASNAIESERSRALQISIPVAAITGLSATFAFWLYFIGCCQRQLLTRLFASFDFLFLLVQLIASDVSSCDLLKWNWIVCCGIFSELLWMTWVLTLDALTPCVRVRLKFKTWPIMSVVVLHLAKQIAFLSDVIVLRQQWSVQNRTLFVTTVDGNKIQWQVFPFLFSRQVTTFVGCVRLIHRIRTCHMENDLMMLLGNVEYECQETQLHLARVAPSRTTPLEE